MPMYWTFNCFLGCIYTVYYIVYIVFLVLNWLSNLEFWLPKKKDQVARIGVWGGGVRGFGQCPKENVFFPSMSSLRRTKTERHNDRRKESKTKILIKRTRKASRRLPMSQDERIWTFRDKSRQKDKNREQTNSDELLTTITKIFWSIELNDLLI